MQYQEVYPQFYKVQVSIGILGNHVKIPGYCEKQLVEVSRYVYSLILKIWEQGKSIKEYQSKVKACSNF